MNAPLRHYRTEIRRHRAKQYSKWFAIFAITFVLTVFGAHFIMGAN